MGYHSMAQAPRRGSQVLDDSTRNVYGPKTTQWISEQDLFYGRNNYQPIDTSIINYHRWNYVNRFNYKYKDLGNIGTALYSVLPELPSAIGVSSGFNVYDQYFLTEEPKYFDTKSPYTRMQIIWGGQGRAMTRIEFSRNINPNWNFGFNYRPILIDRQLQRSGKGNPRQTTSHYYDVYTAFRTKDRKYSMLINYRRIRHNVLEGGGIEIVDSPIDSTYQSLFDPENSPKLTNANSIFQQNQAHLLQQYRIGNALQIYHQSDLGKQINTYTDDLDAEPDGYYDNYEAINPDEEPLTNDSTRFSYWTNALGVKGKVGKLFYNGYVKARYYRFRYKYFTEDTLAIPQTDNEYYLGGNISYEYDSITYLNAGLEYLDGGNYSATIALRSKWIDADARQQLSRPPFIYNAYRGSFDFWNNDFRNVSSIQVSAFGKFRFGNLGITPGFTYTSFSDYIYFRQGVFAGSNQRVLPVQSNGRQELVSPEVRIDIQFLRHLHFRPQVIYSNLLVNDDDALRVPELFVNAQLAYEHELFKRNLQVQVGVDVHWQSAYFDLGYDPAIQQFFVQDQVQTPSFPITDLFFNAKMKRGRFFFKYNNLIQAFTQSGYLPTPVYPGQRNILDFGFELLLFD